MTGDANRLLTVTDAAFGYASRVIVRAVGLTLTRGGGLGVFGPNGSGKTTLVRGLLGLLPPVAGRVERADGLRVGYLPQSRALDTAWPMTGLDAATLAVSGRARFGRVSRDARRAVDDALRALGVHELRHRPFATLSGGQQQRLLLAGAVADRPHVLVLDEPADGLDAASNRRLLATLSGLKAGGLCVVVISHDAEDLLALCDHVAWLRPAETAGGPSGVQHLPTGDFRHALVAAGAA